MRYFYTVLFYLALPFIFLRLLWRSKNLPAYRLRLKERLGYCPHQLEKCILVHAVSLGETIAATPLIKALKVRYPDYPLLVTNMTPTGAARTLAVFGDSVLQTYLPYDLPVAIHRFLERTHPHIIIVMETELWPNLFSACEKRSIPIMIANARLSERSAKKYQAVSFALPILFNPIHQLLAQTDADAARFIKLGLSKDKVLVTGNLKFDLDIPSDLSEKSKILRDRLGQDRFIWIAASTHPGEEEIILDAHKKILEKNPAALLILVPRHPDRFQGVALLCQVKGFYIVKRSDKTSHVDSNVQVYLGDTMGELLLMYSVCDAAFVGGSFAKIGGHNVIEPAALKKPIITGPYLFNFTEASDLLIQAEGMKVVMDAEMLSDAISDLIHHPEKRNRMGENAFHVAESNRGTLQRQLNAIYRVFNVL